MIPWSRRWQLTPVSLPGNPTARVAWWATADGVARHDLATKQQQQIETAQIWRQTRERILAHSNWTSTNSSEPRFLYPQNRDDWNIISWFLIFPPTGIIKLSSVQSLSCVRLFATPWIAARQASLSITNSRSSPRLTSIESVMPTSHLILCRPLLPLPPIPPSIRVFSNESTLRMRWPKYWSFSFSIIPSKEIPGLISFRMDWLDLFAVQGTLKSLLQHHSSKASILWRSAFFTVQLSHPYMTTGKTIASSTYQGPKWQGEE